MNKLLLTLSLVIFLSFLFQSTKGQGSQTVNNGQLTLPVNFQGAGCTYTWVNNTPGIGLPASGFGNIPSFTAVNTTGNPITATITANPAPAGFAYIANKGDGTVSVVNTMTNALTATIPVGQSPYGVSVSKDGSRVYITNQGSNTVSVINTTNNNPTSTITVDASPAGLVVSSDGSMLYVANSGDGTLSVINTLTNTIVSTINVGVQPTGVCISPDNQRVYVANYKDGTISAINTATNVVLASISIGGSPYGLAISPDGSTLYASNGDTYLYLINTSSNTVANKVLLDLSSRSMARGISISADGKYVYIADGDYYMDVVYTPVLGVLVEIPTPFSSNIGISAIPDGRVYATDGNLVSVIDWRTRAVSYVKVGANPVSLGNFVSQGPGCNSSPVTFTITVNNSVLVNSPPNISYSTPQSYTVNLPITPLTPINTGGPVSYLANVSTLAGHWPSGKTDGLSATAGFSNPYSVVTDATGNIYVADQQNNLIRKTTPSGLVTTIAGSGAYGSNDGVGQKASFNSPYGIAIDAAGNLYVADSGNNLIRKIAPDGTVTTIAGSGIAGSADGIGKTARFNTPVGIGVDATGNVYVSESVNLIRKITAGGVVTTIAGSGRPGFKDGQGTAALFSNPTNLAIDASGNIYVSDAQNNRIRKITPQGLVSTFAGNGTAGYADGPAATATFSEPVGITIDPKVNFYVFDALNGVIRKIATDGVVTTIAGTLGQSGYRDGVGNNAAFGEVRGLTADNFGNLYLGDALDNTIRKVSQGYYSIDKTLPSGLTFDPLTGIISGTPTAVSATTDYTVTANNASGSSKTVVTITVIGLSVINTAAATGAILVCAGSPSASPNIQQFTVTGNTLTADITAAAPPGFEISLAADSGYGRSIVIAQTGGTVNNIIVFVRSSASASGNISGNVALTSPGAATQNVAVTGIVNALPTVGAVANQKILNGNTIATIHFTGTATAFNWVNDTPGIGLLASGTGDIAAFFATNTGSSPIIANVTVTPVNTKTGCNGATVTFAIEVDPPPSPSITASGTLTGLTTVYGVASSSTSFMVAGANMTAGILVNPPPGFEVSTDNLNFTSTITVGTAGTNLSLPVYIRLASATPVGSYSGNINLTSPGAVIIAASMPASTVTPAPLTIAVNNVTKIYGVLLSSGPGATAFTATGLQNNETIGSITDTYGTGAAGSATVATYAGSIIGSAATGGTFQSTNYTITYVPGDIIIDKAGLTITADNKTKTRGAPNPILTATYTGFVNNETPAQLTALPVLSTTATATSFAGIYTITVAGGSSPNYAIIPVNGILTIFSTISIPNAFTPNGDGINDVWAIESLSNYPKCTVSVFNRSGLLIYYSTGYSSSWDGTYKSIPVPVGTYYYTINLENGNDPLAGSVTIIR